MCCEACQVLQHKTGPCRTFVLKYTCIPLIFVLISGSEKILFKNHNGEVEEFDCLSNESRVIMDNSTFVRKFKFCNHFIISGQLEIIYNDLS